MPKFNISWTEEKSLTVEATDKDDAKDIWAERGYKDEDVEVDCDDEPQIIELGT